MNALPTVGLFRSPPELESFSMDQYADQISSVLARVGQGSVSVHEARPPQTRLSQGLSRSLGTGRTFTYWRRFPSYMRFARQTGFTINHVLDHAYGHLVFALPAERTVVTCHDIFPLKRWKGELPGLPRRPLPPLTLQVSLAGLRRAGTIVTPTAATRTDLEHLAGIDPERVTVVPYGLNPVFRAYAPDERQAARAALPVSADVIRLLAIDSGGAYKNHAAIASVLARLREQGRRVVLVHVGSAAAMLAAARRVGVADAVVPLRSKTPEELVAVYNGCDVLLFPSYYEGFGWPPLEAMACGVPVVASTAAAVSEVVAGCARQSDADDHDALVRDVGEILDDAGLREHLIRSGEAHAAVYTWERAAARLLAIYEQRLGAALV